MKKTIITALLSIGFAAAASAISLEDAVTPTSTTTGTSGKTVNVAEAWGTSPTDFTLTFTLDASKLDAIIGSKTGTVTSNVAIDTLVSVKGTVHVGLAIGTGAYGEAKPWNGLCAIYNSDAATTDTVLSAAKNSQYLLSSNASSPGVGGLFETDISDVVSAAVTFTSRGSKPWTAYLTLVDSKGTSTTYYGSDNSMTFGNTIGSLTSFSYDDDLVTSIYLMKGVVSSATEATALNTAAIKAVPEPATATLSLLALAGLAARRRRK